MSSLSEKSDILFKIFVCFAVLLLAIFLFRLTADITSLHLQIINTPSPLKPSPTSIPYPEAGASASIKPTQTPLATKTPAATPSPAPANSNQVRQTTYIPLEGVTSTTLTDWTDVPGSDAFIDIGVEYGKNAYVTWEATLSVQAGSGEVDAQLIDVTHGVAVPGSEIATDSGDFAFIQSGKLTLLSGNNRYRVQIKSKTSTQVTFYSGRIKIVY